MASSYAEERAQYLEYLDESSSSGGADSHTVETTPLFSLAVKHNRGNTKDVHEAMDDLHLSEAMANQVDNLDQTSIAGPSTTGSVLSQYSLLGFHVGDHPDIEHKEPIMLNTRAPNSTFLCGSQGSGKSYTLGCILENCLLPDSRYGKVANPVAGVAFHYDNDATTAAEIASLCSRGVDVNVLVPSSNFKTLNSAYDAVSRKGGTKPNVKRLLLKDDHLNIERMYKLMAFNESSDNGIPLYVAVINDILLNMAKSETTFKFANLEKKLNEVTFAPAQRNMLDMRMKLLKTFLNSKADPDHRCEEDLFALEPGSLTIVDLTDPFIDDSMVCTLFDIALSLFKQRQPKDGLIITLDEAHKYLKQTTGALKFTEHLLSTIRMQRHHATRVIIATQEPTISGSLLDLCSTSIVHRFSSPAWFDAIKEHISAASHLVASSEEQKSLFEQIVNLGTGQSLVFSPSSFLRIKNGREETLGTGHMKMKTRSRVGQDLGKSKMAGER